MTRTGNPGAAVRGVDAAVLFAVALGLRLLYLAELQGDPFAHALTSNAALYDELGRAIAGGARLSPASGAQPLYPYLVGAIYTVWTGPLAVRLVQALIGAAVAPLLAVGAGAVVGRRAALVGGLLWALHWPAVFYGGELLPDTVVTGLLVVALTAGWRALGARRPLAGWLVCGGALGLATLGKPNALLWAPLPPLAAWCWPGAAGGTRGGRALAALVVPALVVAALLGGRALYATGSGAASSTFMAKTLWDGNHDGSDGINAFLAETPAVLSWEEWHAIDGGATLAARFRREIVEYARRDPVGFLGLQARKAAIYVSTYEVGNNVSVRWRRARSTSLSLPGWLGFGAVLALAVPGIAVALRRRRDGAGGPRAHLWPLLAALVWSASIVAILVAGRYRLPCTAVLCVYAGVGAVALFDAARARDRRALAPLLALAAAGALAASLDPLGLRDHRTAAILQHEAQVLERAGDVSGADQRYVDGIELEVGGAQLQRSHGLFLVRHGRIDEGLAAMRTAAARRPELATLHKDLGAVLRDQGRAGEAIAPLTTASGLAPDDAGIWYNLGLALADSGRLEEADAAFGRSVELGDDSGAVRLERGVVRARLARWEMAEMDLREAAARLDDPCVAWRNLALLYARTDRPDEADAARARCAASGGER